MMDVAIVGAFTTLWWISSATIFLPLLFILKYNKTFRDWWFTYILNVKFLKNRFDSLIAPQRKKAFELLRENLSGQDASKHLKVLEIGIASGENLQFYPENSHLTAVDMNPNFDAYFRQNQKKFPQIVYERMVISMAENMEEVEDSSMDVVISTYVLCSVTSVKDVLKEVKRVLKPGGKFVFLEHVNHSKSEWAYTLQQFAAPLWKIYCDGCCLIRDIGYDIKSAGFSDVIIEKVVLKSLFLFIRAQIYGVATK